MICKHCGYDVMKGIDYCTNCGEPMPKPVEEEKQEEKEVLPDYTEKEFAKNYIPYSVRLAIHTGTIMSYFYAALYIILSVGGMILLGKITFIDTLFLIVSVVLALLTLGFHRKKNTFCAVVITAVSVLFSIYCFVSFRQITFIWIFAGILGCYGTMKYNKLWNDYKKKGILPKKLD
ncbi:MAG: hypothetical protein ACI3W6_08365 [Clostridia bacterium]